MLNPFSLCYKISTKSALLTLKTSQVRGSIQAPLICTAEVFQETCLNVIRFEQTYGHLVRDNQPQVPRFHGVPKYDHTISHVSERSWDDAVLGGRPGASLERVHLPIIVNVQHI